MKDYRSWGFSCLLLLLFLSILPPSWGQAPEEKAPSIAELKKELDAAKSDAAAAAANGKIAADTMWVLITAMLVFFMNLGFACVESGFCRAKNCVNILSKNFVVFATTSIGFWFLGWGLMFGAGTDWVGKTGVYGVGGADNSPATDALAKVIKKDITAQYGLDFEKDDVKSKQEKALATIDELSEKATAEVTKPETEFPVKVDLPGVGTFAKTYTGKDFYWGAYPSISWPSVPLWAKFFFQLVFAGTAATIVSGAVAERIKYHSFILFTFIMSILIYPIVGHWIWGGGYLSKAGMFDFAGSTVVHSVGGWAALAGVLVLGARLGKFGPDGKINAIPGHNLTAATIGCFVLWFGWFGFNPGSTMAADVNAIGRVCITTNSAAAAGTLTATLASWLLLGKPDLGMTLNGCLAGLVAITAPCMYVTVGSSLIIGAIAGVLVVLAVMMFDRIRVDDPVGALSVHLVNGIFGTICVGLFGVKEVMQSGALVATSLPNDGFFMGGGTSQLMPQLIGVGIVALYVFPVALVAWIVLKATVGIRVSPQEELEGLDIGEHGNEAYHGFVMAVSTEYFQAGSDPQSAQTPGGEKGYKVVVEGAATGELAKAWSELCQPGTSASDPQFKSLYQHMTTVQGNRFRFRGGNPQEMCGQLQSLLKNRLQKDVQTRIEA